jgi:hypothetical protein
MDQLIALKPESLDDAIQVLFFQEMPGYILNMVNPIDYQNLYDLMQQCNDVWENRDPDAGIMYAAIASVQRSHSPDRDNSRSSSPFRRKQTTQAKPSYHRSPTPAPARGGKDRDSWCYYHTCFRAAGRKCDANCSYQEKA